MYTQDDMSVLGVFDETEERTVQDYCLEYNLNLEETEVVMNYLSKALSMDVELNTLISDDEFENAYEILIDTQYSFEGLEESRPVSKSYRRLREVDTGKYTLEDLNKGLKACGLGALESLDDNFIKNAQGVLKTAKDDLQREVNANSLSILNLLRISQGKSKLNYVTWAPPLTTRILCISKSNKRVNILAGTYSKDPIHKKIMYNNLQGSEKDEIYKNIINFVEDFLKKEKISTKLEDPDSIFLQSSDKYLCLINKPNTKTVESKLDNLLQNFSSNTAYEKLFSSFKDPVLKKILKNLKLKKPDTVKMLSCQVRRFENLTELADEIDVADKLEGGEIVINLNADDRSNIITSLKLVNEYLNDPEGSKIKSFFPEEKPESEKDVDSKNSDDDVKKKSTKKSGKPVDVSFRDKNRNKFSIKQPLVKAIVDLEGLTGYPNKRDALRNAERKDALKDLLRDWKLISEKVERSGL